MSFRYSYTATITKSGGTDENGDQIDGTPVQFNCDYQPSLNNININVAGSSVPVSYLVFVPTSCNISFNTGDEIECNGSKGTVALSIPYKFGKMIYVK